MSVELKQRTKEFALRILKVVEALDRNSAVDRTIGSQLVRSGTSVAANYRAAERARSTAEFVSKLHVALEEADETQFWLELLVEHGAFPADRMEPIRDEASQITAILTTSLKTAKKTNKS